MILNGINLVKPDPVKKKTKNLSILIPQNQLIYLKNMMSRSDLIKLNLELKVKIEYH